MHVSLKNQIAAIQNARTLTQRHDAWKDINLASTSEGLNAAGATIAALANFLHTFDKCCDNPTEQQSVALEFFQTLSNAQ